MENTNNEIKQAEITTVKENYTATTTTKAKETNPKPDNESKNNLDSTTKPKPVMITKKIILNQADIEKMLMAREDIDFIADSRAAVIAKNTPLASMTLLTTSIILLFSVIWASVANLDEITVGSGKVVPSAQTQFIQNLEGGIVSKIFVKEGDMVKKGQVLAKLDDTIFAAQYREGYAKWLSLQATISRLVAQTENQNEITFSSEVLKNPGLIRRETDLFYSEVASVKDSLTNLRHTYKLAEDEYKIVAPLVNKGVISKVELLRLEREMSSIKEKVDGYEGEVRDHNYAELTKAQTDYDTITQTLSSLKDRMNRTTLVSPVNGIVNEIYVTTIGGILKSASPLMEVVPLNDQLQIEARIRPSDIGFISVGQKAKVKITAYDYSIYGDMAAKVTKIGATTNTDERGNSYYEIILITDRNYLGNKKGNFPIIPGMTASVDIMTGKKSVMHYIMKPINRAKEKAMRER